MKRSLSLKKWLSIRGAGFALLLIALLLTSITDLQAQTIRYVKENGTGNGASWITASGNTQEMINASGAGEQVWVAEGVYYNESMQSFVMKEGVAIYGGFPSTGEPIMEDRNYTANISRLYSQGGAIVYNNNNNLTRASLLDGFTISFGQGGTMAGGIQNNNASPTLRNLIINNNSGELGGGYGEVNSRALLYNILFVNNAGDDGGAIYTQTSTSEFINNTIYSNTSYNVGSAITHNNSAAVFTNNIIDSNFSYQSTGPVVNVGSGVSGLVFNNNIIQQTGGSANWDTDLGTDGGNNLNSDPMVGYNGTYGVGPASPAVNRGNTTYFPNAATAKDLAGNPRIYQNTIDIGAFELQEYVPSNYYVKQDAQGTGTSWANASGDLQLMINTANALDNIYVAAGNYTPAAGSFTMKEGVKIYGGFAATGNPGLASRNWYTNTTTLTSNGSSVIVNDNNNLTGAAILDGFTITGGITAEMGGGIYNHMVSPAFNNLVITGNSANNGGGFAAVGGNPTITNSVIYNNTSGTHSGAMYFENSTGVITNTTIANNTSGDASIISFNNAAVTINNTIAWNTEAGNIHTTGVQLPTFTSSLIQGSTDGTTWNSDYGINGGNNINNDPLFTDFANNNYSIGISSSAYNTGDIALFPDAVTAKDASHYKRVDGGAIEIGAYEVRTETNIHYVKMEATGDGSSWDNASGDLQLMIDTNIVGGQVWVAGGYYYPSVTGESFSMKEGVEIYGGFPGSGNPGMADRNPVLNGCQLTTNGNATVFLNVNNNLTHAAVLDGFTVSNGISQTAAGGIQNTNSSPTLRNLRIHSCDGVNGGGYGEVNSNAVVYNVLLYNNFAQSGGAISSENSTSVFTNITLSGNQASEGGGAFRHSNTSSVIQNSVVWSNYNYENNESNIITSGMPNGLTFISSIVQGSGGDDNWSTAYGSNGGGNIDADAMLKNDYTLKPTSPAINSGNTALFPDAATAKDIAGNLRVFQNTIDRGAFEYQESIVTNFYVKQDATGNGSSWADASGDLQLMINNATTGDQIWVAAGTYIPTESFSLKNGVNMYGGFPATGDPGMNNRDPKHFISQLSSAADPALLSNDAGITANTVIDGFKALTSGATAVSLTGASPVLNNFTVTNNTGTAIALINSEARIINLTVANNTGTMGAVSITGTSAGGNSPLITNTLIYNNVFTGNGGGMIITQSSPVLTNVTIASNTAGMGGGIYIDEASPVINNSIIYGNVNDNIAGTSSATFTSSLIGGSGGSTTWNAALGTDGGNNTDADPLFADIGTGDYNLLSGSPAADTGDASLFADAATSKDLAGNLRVIGLGIDRGALESLANINITYIKQDATGDGTSWDDATGNLANAIARSSPGDEVWVAAGTYFPQDQFFELKAGVKIYGGFPSVGNPGMAERDWSTNVSLMSNTAYDQYDYNYILRQSGGGVTITTLLDGFSLTMADGVNGIAMYLYEASPTLKNLTIKNNTRGSMQITNASPVISNVLLLNNVPSGGEAFHIEGVCSPIFTNITITGTTSNYLSVFYGCTPIFYNSIINVGIAYSNDSNATFVNCYVKDSGGSADWESNQTDGGNNLDGDLTLLSDGSIMPGSIVVNAGNNTYTNAAGITVDIAFNPRIYDDVVDIGAYEEQGAPIVSIRYVRVGGTGDGSSWDNASGNLQDMIDISQQGNKVLVAAGTYLTREGDYFEMKEGVSIYGGYAPTGNPGVDERDWAVNSTILSGNGDDSGAVIAYELSEESVLDGFVLVNSSGYYATAIYTYESYAIFNNLVIRDNAADSNGGAIYSEDGAPVFNNIVVYNNSSIPIVNYGASPVFNNLTISGNTNSAFIHNDYESYPIFNNSILWQDGTVTGEDDSASVFLNSIVKNSGGSNNWNVALGTNGGNNLDIDPLFTNPAADDYTLQESSPAINAGDTSLYPNAAASKDLAGNPRLDGAAIDMGAFEKEASVCSIATTWDGTTWSNGIPTSYNYAATFTGNYTSVDNETLTACSVAILSGNIVVTPGSVFNVKGAVTVANGASLTFMNNAHLVQIDDVDNSGNITSHRNSSDLFRLDYTMWSSPVEMQNLKVFSRNTVTSRFYKYDTESNHYISGDNGGFNPLTDSFEAATGYLIRMPQTGSSEYNNGLESSVFDGTFTGVPHNGNINFELSHMGERFNLIGNPYPSPLDLTAFFAGNTQSIDGIIYIWRKRNAQEVTSSYVTINSVGDFVGNNQNGAQDPDGILQTGQGFIVRAQENAIDTDVHFTNLMRSSDTNHDGSFLRSGTVEKHRLWLDLSNNEGFISQMLIGYRTGATMEVDMGIDAVSISDGNKALSSWLNSNAYVIQGRSLPFSNTDTVPMQFKTDVAGQYSISLSGTDGLFEAGQAVYIKDNLTGSLHDVQRGAYNFLTDAGTFNNRFEVRYRDVPLLSTSNGSLKDSDVVVYKKDKTIYITTGNTLMKAVKVFDIQGRLVYSNENLNAMNTEISNLTLAEQMLIVQITTTQNATVSKKIIY